MYVSILSLFFLIFSGNGSGVWSLTFIADRGVGTKNVLLGSQRLILGQNGTGDLDSRHHVILGQLEAEALGVVVDHLDLLELEADPIARQRLLGSGARDLVGNGAGGLLHVGLGLLGGRSAGEEVVSDTGETGGTSRVEERVAALLGGVKGGLFGGIAAELLHMTKSVG